MIFNNLTFIMVCDKKFNNYAGVLINLNNKISNFLLGLDDKIMLEGFLVYSKFFYLDINCLKFILKLEIVLLG